MTIRFLGLLAAAAIVSAGPEATAQPPASEARLTIGEDAYTVPLGKPFAIRLGNARVTMRIDPQTEQTFDEAGVSFRYPLGFRMDKDSSDPAVTIWTVQGDKAAILLQRYEDDLDPQSLAEVLLQNLGPKGAKRQAVKLNAVEAAYAGTQVVVDSPREGNRPATRTLQNVFTFANEQGVFALLVQDVRAPKAGDSDEYSAALELLSESLTTGPPPKAKPADDR